MKQHITPDDIQQLSEEGQANYLKYFAGKDDSELVGNISGKIIHPLLSIGQMIEFLDERVKCLSCMKNQQEGADEWIVAYVNYLHKNKELCDALWEACKSVLEEVVQIEVK